MRIIKYKKIQVKGGTINHKEEWEVDDTTGNPLYQVNRIKHGDTEEEIRMYPYERRNGKWRNLSGKVPFEYFKKHTILMSSGNL